MILNGIQIVLILCIVDISLSTCVGFSVSGVKLLAPNVIWPGPNTDEVDFKT